MKIKLIILILLFYGQVKAQVGIGTTTPKALLDIPAVNPSNPYEWEGIILPYCSISLPTPNVNQAGLITSDQVDGEYGFHYWNGTSWVLITNRTHQKINDMSDGKSDNDSSEDYSSVFLGMSAGLNDDQSDNRNVGVGFNVMLNNTTGEKNVAIGYETLRSNVSSVGNTAIGYQSLLHNTGFHNTGAGFGTLYSNTTGDYNTAVGSEALYFNTIGTNNTAVGYGALRNNTYGSYNSAMGAAALWNNIGGSFNSAMGYYASFHNISANYNVAIGSFALQNNTISNDNVAIGYESLKTTTGERNTAVGYQSGFNLVSGTFNTFIGYQSQTTFGSISNSTAIGYQATVTGSNMVRFGNPWVSSIGGNGNWTNISDKRFKMNIKENIPGLKFILKLRPVTYHLNVSAINKKLNISEQKIDKKGIRDKTKELQIGFIAQEVEKTAKSIGFNFHGVDTPDNETDFYGLRYAEFVVPLVKALQEQQDQIEENKNTIKTLETQYNELFALKKQLVELKKSEL
ncbi:MAG: tail fiber domain-containing protein [Flavobacteriales bacterium]